MSSKKKGTEKIYRVRFHLAKGPHFEYWQIKDERGNVEYHNPDEVTILMEDCTLKNHKKTAQKIFNGADKTVCAWIQCRAVQVIPKLDHELDHWPIKYNPRVKPYWHIFDKCVDNRKFPQIYTIGREVKLYMPPIHE